MIDTTKSATSAGTSPKVVFERTYLASVDELWALWTTKEGLESWWGPAGFRTAVHAIEARQTASCTTTISPRHPKWWRR